MSVTTGRKTFDSPHIEVKLDLSDMVPFEAPQVKLCWFCNKEEGKLEDYAYTESPTHPIFIAHSDCVRNSGTSAELVAVKP